MWYQQFLQTIFFDKKVEKCPKINDSIRFRIKYIKVAETRILYKKSREFVDFIIKIQLKHR